MLSKAQIKKLSFLTSKIQECHRCSNLYQNGIAVPFWTQDSKIMIMAESPGKTEVQKNYRTPLVGKAGRLLFRELARKKIHFLKEDFLILNTVQCRPVLNDRNGKPSKKEIENCRFWTEKYIDIFSPKLILSLGNFSMSYFFGKEHLGTINESGNVRVFKREKEEDIRIIPCVHPASVLYNPRNIDLFRLSLQTLREEFDVL